MPVFKIVIAEFLVHCKVEKALSKKTLKAYKTDLQQAETFFEANGVAGAESLHREHLRSYLCRLTREFKPRSCKRKLASLKALLNYLEREDLIPINPMRKMQVRIRNPEELPRTIAMSQIDQLFGHLYSLKGQPGCANLDLIRDIAILELLFATGMRVSEVVGLSRADVNIPQCNIRILGKGSRERIVPLCHEAVCSALSEYLALNETQKRDPLFLNRLGNRYSAQSVRNMIRKRCRESGIESDVTPHMFRHTVATRLLENGVDIRYIQSLLGHKSITTTQIYTHIDTSASQRILSSHHPRLQLRLK